jgi:hypothetical protein
MLHLALLLAASVPPGVLLDDPVETAVVVRAHPKGEPVRGVVEYGSALAAMTLVNVAGSAFLNGSRVTVSQQGSASLDGSAGSIAAGVCFALSPMVAAVTSWAIGKGSDDWNPSLGWAMAGAYGSAAVAVGAGLGLSAAGISHDSAVVANTALYLAVPLGTVLVQNATKTPR